MGNICRAWCLSGFFARNSYSRNTNMKAGKTSEVEKTENERKYFALRMSVVLFFFNFLFFTSVQASENPKRIISLAPSMTEILFALGLGDQIAGVTSFCDYPEEAKKKEKIGGMSNPSLESIVLLKPDIVVMTTDGNPKEFEERLRSLKIRTYVFRARKLSELAGGIRDLGVALNVSEKSEKLAGEIENSLNKFKVRSQKNSELQTPNSKLNSSLVPRSLLLRKKVIFIIWPEPLIVAGPGTAIDEAIKLLGHENIASKSNTTYPKYSIEEVMHQSPDVIFIGKGHVNMHEVSKGLLKRWKNLPAVKNNAICYVSDNLYRLGPRVIHGIEEIAECLK